VLDVVDAIRIQAHRPDCALAGVVHQLAGQKQEGRTKSLAAAGAKVLTDLCNRPNARHGVAPELALDGGEIVVQQVKHFLGSAGYGRIQAC